jgi:hypothetical protein
MEKHMALPSLLLPKILNEQNPDWFDIWVDQNAYQMQLELDEDGEVRLVGNNIFGDARPDIMLYYVFGTEEIDYLDPVIRELYKARLSDAIEECKCATEESNALARKLATEEKGPIWLNFIQEIKL